MSQRNKNNLESLQAILEAVLVIDSEVNLSVILKKIVSTACSLTNSKYGALGIINAERKGLSDFIYVGITEEEAKLIGPLPQGKGILGLLIKEPHVIRLSNLADHPSSCGFPPHHPIMKSFIGAPIKIKQNIFGNIYLTEKNGSQSFSEQDEELIKTLAIAAGIAIENARLQKRIKTLDLADERERIARDLHDLVIQRIFATGLNIQSIIPQIEQLEIASKLQTSVDELDETIRQIRTSIFGLETYNSPISLRGRILELTNEFSTTLGFDPIVSFEGPIDHNVSESLGKELLGVLRESLTNIAKHSKANSCQVKIEATSLELSLIVTDSGIGIDQSSLGKKTGLGLKNIAKRASLLKGSLIVNSNLNKTELIWKVPINP